MAALLVVAERAGGALETGALQVGQDRVHGGRPRPRRAAYRVADPHDGPDVATYQQLFFPPVFHRPQPMTAPKAGAVTTQTTLSAGRSQAPRRDRRSRHHSDSERGRSRSFEGPGDNGQAPIRDTQGMDFLLRDATSDDLPRLQEIFRRSSLSNEGDRPALVDHPEALVYTATSFTAGRARVATVRPDLIAGFATTITGRGFLELVDLFTDPDWMRRGVATALINDVVTFAATVGAGRVSVTGNPHAVEFYQRAGFVAEGHVATEFGEAFRMNLKIPR